MQVPLRDAPEPLLHVLAIVRLRNPSAQALCPPFVVLELNPRGTAPIGFEHHDHDHGTAVVQWSDVRFDRHTATVWRPDDTADGMYVCDVELHDLQVVHNEDSLEGAIEWIRGDPALDPTIQPNPKFFVRNTNREHNPHQALLYLMDAADMRCMNPQMHAECLQMWDEGQIHHHHFQLRREDLVSAEASPERSPSPSEQRMRQHGMAMRMSP